MSFWEKLSECRSLEVWQQQSGFSNVAWQKDTGIKTDDMDVRCQHNGRYVDGCRHERPSSQERILAEKRHPTFLKIDEALISPDKNDSRQALEIKADGGRLF